MDPAKAIRMQGAPSPASSARPAGAALLTRPMVSQTHTLTLQPPTTQPTPRPVQRRLTHLLDDHAAEHTGTGGRSTATRRIVKESVSPALAPFVG
jgi:hypothetical protein